MVSNVYPNRSYFFQRLYKPELIILPENKMMVRMSNLVHMKIFSNPMLLVTHIGITQEISELEADYRNKMDGHSTMSIHGTSKRQTETFFPFSTIIVANDVKEVSPNCCFRPVRTLAYLCEILVKSMFCLVRSCLITLMKCVKDINAVEI